MNDLIEGTRHTGEVLLDGKDIYDRTCNLVDLRRRVGHGLPEVEPVPQVDLRERGVRPEGGGAARPLAAAWRSASVACAGPPCGTRSRIGWTTRP